MSKKGIGNTAQSTPIFSGAGNEKILLRKKRSLLLIAGIVWLAAGFNAARLGIISYGSISVKLSYILLSAAAFLAFGAMFFRMTRKHTGQRQWERC